MRWLGLFGLVSNAMKERPRFSSLDLTYFVLGYLGRNVYIHFKKNMFSIV